MPKTPIKPKLTPEYGKVPMMDSKGKKIESPKTERAEKKKGKC